MQYNRRVRVAAGAAALATIMAMMALAAPSAQIAQASCGTNGIGYAGGQMQVGSVVATNFYVTAPTYPGVQWQCTALAQWGMIGNTDPINTSQSGYVQAGWFNEGPATNYETYPFVQAHQFGNNTMWTYYLMGATPNVSSTYSAHNYYGSCNGQQGSWMKADYNPFGTWLAMVPAGTCLPSNWTAGANPVENYMEESHNSGNYWGDAYDGVTSVYSEYYCTGAYDCNPAAGPAVNAAKYINPTTWNACVSLNSSNSQSIWDARENGGHC